MNPERRRQTESIFHSALGLDAIERAAFLDRACAGDEDLRREVGSLLAAHEQAGSFLQDPAAEILAESMAADATGSRPGLEPPLQHRMIGKIRAAPWWMYVVAASFLALFALNPYLWIYGPEDIRGAKVRFAGGATEIREVTPGSEMDRVGLRPGDLVLTIDGQPVGKGQDWVAVKANMEVGKAQHWDIARGGERLALTVIPHRIRRDSFYSVASLVYNIGMDSGWLEQRLCPQCGTCYDTGASRCAYEQAALTPVRVPRLLAGRYRLERRRGRGGMGAVYEATDSALERRVAVKVIRDDIVGSPDAAERFRREARAAASFTHPNVVTVHDFGVEAQMRAFLVMELLEGSTLREELRRLKRFDPGRTVQILRAVCAAVEAAHRRQIIHRDLKPENIFLARTQTSDGSAETVKVLDFGIAKFLPLRDEAAETGATMTETGPGVLVGTAAYMSPEQLLGESVTAGWDLWSLGVVAYEMLTGALPFPSSSDNDWRAAILSGRFLPVSHHVPQTSERRQGFFVRAFATSRSGRPASAQEFIAELEAALS